MNMGRMWRRAGMWALGAAITGAQATTPVVSNVRAWQRAGTKLVDIYYNVSDADSRSLSVGVAVSINDGALAASSFSDGGGAKSVGSGVSPGDNRWIVWNAGADWNGQFSSIVKFEVTADDSPALDGDYMVIDLSEGPSATSYPVSYLDAVPAGGWTDDYKTTKLVLRRIPATAVAFEMGSPADELGRYGDEAQHGVTLTQSFYVGVFEVTQKQWERVAGTWPSYFDNASYRDFRPVEQVSYDDIRGASAGANWPANGNVDADSFMGRLRARTGQAFDLPTEAQWEYACRAGTTTALNSGYNLAGTDSDARMSEVGRYWYNGGSGYRSGEDTSVGTAKAGSYQANAWGLYDMHGNVWEWGLDGYGTYPGTVSDPKGAVSGSLRVLLGGCWNDFAWYCRSAIRSSNAPDNWIFNLGFRAVRTLP